ncbi:MAG: type II toxin-antitoxin system VapC family toxin [Treponema sp.]|jgi:predicted nucleic acid-binding protein|nr:type II toxin-antitoxin system VapC family toxin [Treponema sp.]
MTVVIDVSGAVEILLQKEKVDEFSRVMQAGALVIAPDLYVSELTNTLWKYHKAKIYTEDECVKYIQNGIKYIDKFIDSKEIWQEAFSEGKKNKHSIYDMFYMVAARRSIGTLITADTDLAAI